MTKPDLLVVVQNKGLKRAGLIMRLTLVGCKSLNVLTKQKFGQQQFINKIQNITAFC